MNEPPSADVIHRLKNHVALIVGFSELLLAEFPENDPRRGDVMEVHQAAREAMAMIPEVERRTQKQGDGAQ